MARGSAPVAAATPDGTPPALRAFGRSPALQTLPLCPEIRLWLLGPDVDLEADCATLRDGEPAPYWAFCWGAGQALARVLLDQPARVCGLRVVDFGAGSGVAAIAAALAGARSVIAVDIDSAARCAAEANARVNGVAIGTADRVPDAWDVLLASDVLYEPEILERLLAMVRDGRRLILADPERTSAPRVDREPLARMEVRTLPDVDSPMRTAAVWVIEDGSRRARVSRA